MGRRTVMVQVRCVACGAMREIGPDEISSGDVPMCQRCFSPMVALAAVAPARGAIGRLAGEDDE